MTPSARAAELITVGDRDPRPSTDALRSSQPRPPPHRPGGLPRARPADRRRPGPLRRRHRQRQRRPAQRLPAAARNAQNQVISPQEKTALKQTQLNPTDAAAWAALVIARYTTPAPAATTTRDQHLHRRGQEGARQHGADWQQLPQADQDARAQLSPFSPPAPTARSATTPTRRGLGDQSTANPNVGQGLRVSRRVRLRRQADPQGRSRLRKALTPGAEARQSTLKSEIEAAKTTPTIAPTAEPRDPRRAG